MPIIIAAIVAYGTFGGYVAVDSGKAKQAYEWVGNELSPTQEQLAREAREMMLESTEVNFND